MNNQLQINPPKGYEIDQDKSDLSKGVVYFKEVKKVFTYKDLGMELFYRKNGFYISGSGNVSTVNMMEASAKEANTSATKAQLESILALNKLCNVAKYLNNGWLPESGQEKFAIYNDLGDLEILKHNSVTYGMIYFKTQEYAKQAIEILGEKETHKAVTLNH